MAFWDLSDGEDVSSSTNGEFDAGGGNMEVIPDNTSVKAIIDEAKWAKTQDEDEYISLRWTILAPEEFKNRKVFQKIWVADDKPGAKDAEKTRDKAKRMLAAIDLNAGGKLLAGGKRPTDETLTGGLTNKPMVIKIMVWEMEDRATGKMNQGNWVGAVSPKSSPITSSEEAAKKIASTPPKAQSSGRSRQGMDDEIPF